jgi:hypothetical protein
LMAVVLKLTAEGSLALVSIGAIALLLELPHLSTYFQSKVAKTMREKEYLKTLKDDELETLQEDTLKALWELEELGGEDGLFNYSKSKVTSFVNKPHRENILALLSIKCTPDGSAYEVEETISYTCRAVKKCIQDALKWTTEKDEIRELQKFKFRLEIPTDLFNDPRFAEAHPLLRRRVEEFDKDEPPKAAKTENIVRKVIRTIWPNTLEKHAENQRPAELKKYEDGEGYTLSLDAYKNIDKLDVRLYLKYVAPVGRSFTWQMTHPSKNVTVIIIFPQQLFLYLDTFGVSSDHLHRDRELDKDSPQILRYNSWLLPESGFVFHFIRREGNLTPARNSNSRNTTSAS